MVDYLAHMSSYLSDTSFEDFPPSVIDRAKEVLADTIAVITAGSQEEEVRALIRETCIPGGPQIATLPGAGIRTELLKAGLINGTAGTFLELDEGNQFARGHAGVHVVPAALAVAEGKRLSGRDLLTALVLGYEICARIGIACKIRMSMHPHGTWGTVGAAVAVAKLMGYKAPAMTQIINVSSSLGLATSRRTMLEGGTVRNVYAGVSGFMGVLAHHLVHSGFTGEADGLQTIFGQVVSETFDPDAMIEDLGKRFEISRNYFKMHACCRYNHGSLDALEKIINARKARPIRPEEIAGVEVETYSLAAQLCDRNPKNTLAAKFSIPFAIATFIFHGKAGIDCFKEAAVNDPTIKALAQKVTVSEDPNLTAMMPDRRPSRVRVTLLNGEQLEADTYMNKGDFEDPYGSDDLEEKYFSLVDPIWGHEKAQNVFSSLMKAEELQDINQMTALIAPPI